LIDGKWHTITLTYNGAGLLSLYIDGAFVQSFTTTNQGIVSAIVYNTKGDSNWLGTQNGSKYPYIGYLKNINFYNYAFTATEAGVPGAPSVSPSTITPTIAPSITPSVAAINVSE